MHESLSIFLQRLPEALANTVAITIGVVGIALALGIVLAALRLSGSRLAATAARIVVDAGRTIPMLIVVAVVYFGLLTLSVRVPAILAGTLGIGIKLSFYLAEVFRSGIQAVPKGTVEAAMGLGMSKMLIQRRVVVPLAVRIMFPSVAQYIVIALLDSSFVSVIGGRELTGVGRNIIDIYFATELWFVVAMTYFLMAWPLTRILNLVERRIRVEL